MRRRPGQLFALEVAILEAGRHLGEFHGFRLATELQDSSRAKKLTAYGTLYKALRRLEGQGLLESRWESEAEQQEGRPRRRLYRLTALGLERLDERSALGEGLEAH